MKKLKDLTPDYFKKSCFPLPGCPAIFEHETDYYIIGKLVYEKKLGVANRLSKGEVLIKLPKHIIDNKK